MNTTGIKHDDLRICRLREFFIAHLPTMIQQASGLLKFNYLSPGGTYSGQLWDWDAFWLNRGLMSLQPYLSEVEFRRLVDAGLGSWKNFFLHQADNGALPILTTPLEGDPFSCTTEGGVETNQAKPVFGQFALDLFNAGVSADAFTPYLKSIRAFHKRWRKKYGARNGLLTWGSDTAIGVDNDPTTYGRPEFSSASLLLNCLYHADLIAVATLAQHCGDSTYADACQQEADRLAEAVMLECWDERDGFFYTVDVQSVDQRSRYIPAHVPRGMNMSWQSLPLKIQTFCGFLPLGMGCASSDQIARVRSHFLDPTTFLAECGVRTLSAKEKMFSYELDSSNPSNWLGPIWSVANYMVWDALRKAGLRDEASLLAEKSINLLYRDLAESGTLHECYHPDTGTPNFNAGFLNWNILALLMSTGG